MPITFDEISAEVTPPPAAQQASPAATAPVTESLREQLERELFLIAERRERVSDR